MNLLAMLSDETFTILGGALALLCLWAAMRAGRRRRLIDNLPTCKTAGVFIGLIELKGTAEAEQPLVSFLAERSCVLYEWRVEEHWSRTVTETYTDSKGKTQTRTRHESGWERVAGGGEQTRFYLRDDCGVIRVNPERAKIEPLCIFDITCGRGDPLYYAKGPAGAVRNSDHERRFHETAIPLRTKIYVVGYARERDDIVAPEIAAAPHTPLFLISTRSEAQVSAGLSAQFWVLGVLGLIPAVGGWLLRDHGLFEPATRIPVYAAVGAVYLGVWVLTWAWMAFNSLIELRQRVRQAWANVDVQLRRRADLIPNLVRVIEGLRDYELNVQVQLAQLRRQLEATAPGEPGPDPEGCVAGLLAVVERYPELKASEAFLGLQKGLADTEQRIALARDYFNTVATFYNTRLERVPDRFIAALGGMRPRPLLSATAFERAPVQVDLAAPAAAD